MYQGILHTNLFRYPIYSMAMDTLIRSKPKQVSGVSDLLLMDFLHTNLKASHEPGMNVDIF